MCVFLLWQGRGERDGVVISPPSIPNTVMHRAIFAVHLCVSEKEEKKKQTNFRLACAIRGKQNSKKSGSLQPRTFDPF